MDEKPTPARPEILSPLGQITPEEAERRRRLGEQAARKLGKRFAAPNHRRTSHRGEAALAFIRSQPLLVTGGTLLLSVLLGSWFWGWQFSAGLTALLFLHESGHVWAVRRLGLTVEGMIFVPFLGAAVLMRQANDLLARAFVSLMGPVFGTAGSLACYLLFAATQLPLWRELAFLNTLLTLFNLLPFRPLDGGAIASLRKAKGQRSLYGAGPTVLLGGDARARLSHAYLGLSAFLLLSLLLLRFS